MATCAAPARPAPIWTSSGRIERRPMCSDSITTSRATATLTTRSTGMTRGCGTSRRSARSWTSRPRVPRAGSPDTGGTSKPRGSGITGRWPSPKSTSNVPAKTRCAGGARRGTRPVTRGRLESPSRQSRRGRSSDPSTGRRCSRPSAACTSVDHLPFTTAKSVAAPSPARSRSQPPAGRSTIPRRTGRAGGGAAGTCPPRRDRGRC
jgi:hypothetical protein